MSRVTRLTAELPFLLVLLVVTAGLVRIGQYHWREGATLIGGSLLLAAALRAALPNERAGLIVLRTRAIDVLSYTGLGLMVLYVALSITKGPLA